MMRKSAARSSKKSRARSKEKLFVPLLFLSLLVLPITVFLSMQSQNVRSNAAGTSLNVGFTSITNKSISKNDNKLTATKITTGATAGVLDSVSVYIDSVARAPQNHLQVGLYTDSGSNTPGTLLAGSSSQLVKAKSWNSIAFGSGTQISPNTSYWLVVNVDGSNTQYVRAATSGTVVLKNSTFGTLPQGFGSADQTTTTAIGIYMTESIAATTPSPTPTSVPVSVTVDPSLSPSPTGTASGSVSGEAMPLGDLPGWHQIFAEDFTKDAPLGSWGASCTLDGGADAAASKIVYIGTNGTEWNTYPDCYLDTYQKRPYRSDQVLSVHDGVLDFYLHNVNGQPAGANPSPVLDNATGSRYQAYGRYIARFKVDNNTLSEYYVAWLLWPVNDSDWQCAESDYPEGALNATTIQGFAHYGCKGSQDSLSVSGAYTQWHTFTQEWAPGIRRYYLDGNLIKTSINSVFTQPERWQLQTETNGSGTHSGHLTVDWVAVYSYVAQ